MKNDNNLDQLVIVFESWISLDKILKEEAELRLKNPINRLRKFLGLEY